VRSSPTSGPRRLRAWTGPCTGSSSIWSARNLVFNAVLAEQPPPQRGDGVPSDQLARAYRDSAAELLDAFGQPGVLDRAYQGPLGAATGAERLKIRMYDLLAHGWDLAQALGRPADLPEDAAEGERYVPAVAVSARPGRSPTPPRRSSGWSRSSAAMCRQPERFGWDVGNPSFPTPLARRRPAPAHAGPRKRETLARLPNDRRHLRSR